MNRFPLLLLGLLLLLTACRITKPTTQTTEKPEWVVSRPQSTYYYIGIGTAPKKGVSPGGYRNSAKQNALNDLSSEISVTIESSSVLSTIQTNQHFSQQFVNDIKSSNSLQIEGYQLVGTYEDDDFYWVYYHLSKNDYREWKAQQKQQAIERAKNKWEQAEKMWHESMHYQAFQLYAEALAAVSSYLNETTPCIINNEETDIGITIYRSLLQRFNTSKFVSPNGKISVKKNAALPNETLCFILQDADNRPMENIPIHIDFSHVGLLKNSEKTNAQGKVCASLPQIKSDNASETITLTIDIVTLSRLITDHLTRNILKSLPATTHQATVELLLPTLSINSSEKQLNRPTDHAQLHEHFSNQLRSAFQLLPPTQSTDYTLDIQCNTTFKERYAKTYYVEIECLIQLTNAAKQTVYRKRIKEEAAAETEKAASQAAYQTIIKMFDRTIQREIMQGL